MSMANAQAAFEQNDSDTSLRRRVWRKARKVAAHIPFAEDLLAAYYCAFDRDTPLQVKATLVGALAYVFFNSKLEFVSAFFYLLGEALVYPAHFLKLILHW